MAKQTIPPLPLPKNWPQKVRSAAVHAIALARLALTTARGQAGRTFAGAGLSPAGTTNLCTAHLDHYTDSWPVRASVANFGFILTIRF